MTPMAKTATTASAQVRLGEYNVLLETSTQKPDVFTLVCSFTTEYICPLSLLSQCLFSSWSESNFVSLLSQ